MLPWVDKSARFEAPVSEGLEEDLWLPKENWSGLSAMLCPGRE